MATGSAWVGFYEQSGKKTEMFFRQMTIQSGRIRGSGADPIGEFTINGTVSSRHVKFVKQYRCQHSVDYDGELVEDADGEVIIGLWQIVGFDKGQFKMRHSLWQGFYVYDGHRYPVDFDHFITEDGSIEGHGLDEIGEFTMHGNISGSDVVFSKQYIGQHQIDCRGNLRVRRGRRIIEGKWCNKHGLSDTFQMICAAGSATLATTDSAESFPTLGNDEDFYSILGFRRYQNVSAADVRRAAIQASRKWHPDKHMKASEEYQDACKGVQQMINVARDTLSSSELKPRYDQYLRQKRGEIRAPPPPIKKDPPSFWGKAFRWACNIGLTALGVAGVVVSVVAAPVTLGGSLALGAASGAALSAGIAGTISDIRNPEKDWDEWGKNVGVAALVGGATGGIFAGGGAAVTAGVEAGKIGTAGAIGAYGAMGAGAGAVGTAILDGVDLADGTKKLASRLGTNPGTHPGWVGMTPFAEASVDEVYTKSPQIVPYDSCCADDPRIFGIEPSKSSQKYAECHCGGSVEVCQLRMGMKQPPEEVARAFEQIERSLLEHDMTQARIKRARLSAPSRLAAARSQSFFVHATSNRSSGGEHTCSDHGEKADSCADLVDWHWVGKMLLTCLFIMVRLYSAWPKQFQRLRRGLRKLAKEANPVTLTPHASGPVLCDVQHMAKWMWMSAAVYPPWFLQGTGLFSDSKADEILENLPHDCRVLQKGLHGIDICALAYAVFATDSDKKLVVALRGTFSFSDALTDALAAPEKLDEPLKIGGTYATHAHFGMWTAAKAMDKELKSIMESLLDAHPDFDIIVTGHSLGAGVGTLLALRWRGCFGKRNVSCAAFAPPATLDLEAARAAAEEGVTSVILGCDLVPRLSVHSVINLCNTALDQIPDENKEVIKSDPAEFAPLFPTGRLLYKEYSLLPSQSAKAQVVDQEEFSKIALSNENLISHFPHSYIRAMDFTSSTNDVRAAAAYSVLFFFWEGLDKLLDTVMD